MQPFIKTFIAATLAMGVLSEASAQQRIDSSGIKADELIVKLKAPINELLGGSGTMCGVLSYVNSSLTGNEPCAGVYLNAAWPNPQCPAGHRKIQISGASQGGNIFGGGSSAASYSCMIQPAGAAPWAQNAGYSSPISSTTVECRAAYTYYDEGTLFTVPALYQTFITQQHLILRSDGSFVPSGQPNLNSYSRDDCYRNDDGSGSP